MEKRCSVRAPILLILSFVSACGHKQEVPEQQLPGITYIGVFDGSPSVAESSIFALDGRLVIAISHRPNTMEAGTPEAIIPITFFDAESHAELGTLSVPNFSLATARSHNGTVYIIGNDNGPIALGGGGQVSYHNALYLITTTDMQTFSAPIMIYAGDDGVELSNPSFTFLPDDSLAMAVQYRTTPTSKYAMLFMTAPSATGPWQHIGGTYVGPWGWNASPSITYNAADNYFYVLYAGGGPGGYVTAAMRTRDFVHFKTSKYLPIMYGRSSNGQVDTAATDVELVEHAGCVHFVYLSGDQGPIDEQLSRAIFPGSFAEFARALF